MTQVKVLGFGLNLPYRDRMVNMIVLRCTSSELLFARMNFLWQHSSGNFDVNQKLRLSAPSIISVGLVNTVI